MPQEKPAGYFRRNGWALAAISAVAWVANDLHFTRFGLYADDWYYAAYPFLCGFRDWMWVALGNNLNPALVQGRPLQLVFGYAFAEIGALAGSLAVDYAIAYLLFTAGAWLLYEVVRRRFSARVAALAAVIFVLTPLDTLHQFLNGQFSFAPAFLFVFTAMILYQRGHRVLSYFAAAPALLCYESVYFLFLPAPLLVAGPLWRGRVREWRVHLAAVFGIVALYFSGRSLIDEKRVSALPHRFELLWDVIHSWFYYALTSFAAYVHAMARAPETGLEAWIFAALLFALAGLALSRQPRTRGEQGWSPIAVALIFLACGYVLSYFFQMPATPHMQLNDRGSRIHVAGTFGSSLLVALLFEKWIGRSRGKLLPAAVCSAFLAMLFLYSFVLQRDYVDDWREQRAEIAQILALTPDAGPDSLIIVQRPIPRPRAIGSEKTVFEWHFPHICPDLKDCPTLFDVYSSAWQTHLRLDPDGYMSWTEPLFDGRSYPVSGRYRPGRFIVLDEAAPGVIVRPPTPIEVAGVQIVQFPEGSEKSFWSKIPSSKFTRLFLTNTNY